MIHSSCGQDATFLGDFEAARVHFARAATLVPKYSWRFLGPGLADYARGHLDDAIVNDRLQFEQDPRRPDAVSELAWLYLDLGMFTQARLAFEKKTELKGRSPFVGVEQSWVALAEGKPASLPARLGANGLDQPLDTSSEIDRLVMWAIAGSKPVVQALDAVREAMWADTVPWGGSYCIFLGRFAWIDLAILYDLAGSPFAGAALLDDAQAMLASLSANGNACHTIPSWRRASPRCAARTTWRSRSSRSRSTPAGGVGGSPASIPRSADCAPTRVWHR